MFKAAGCSVEHNTPLTVQCQMITIGVSRGKIIKQFPSLATELFQGCPATFSESGHLSSLHFSRYYWKVQELVSVVKSILKVDCIKD